MEDINNIISNLSDDDIGRLKSLANDLFGNNQKNELAAPQKSDVSSDMFDPATLNRVMNIVSSIKGDAASDDRTKFIASLKPLLSDKRQQKADEAMKMMHLFEILPALKESGLF